MRKLFSLFVALLATTSLLAFNFGGLYYNVTSSSEPYTVEVTYQEANSSSNYSDLITATIPAGFVFRGHRLYYSVTSIGDSAFLYCSSLTSITIPNSVTSIGDYAFSWCSSLTSITIPNSVTSIGNGAFADCRSLNTIYLEATTPPTLDGSYVFRNTPSLTCYIPSGTHTAYEASDWAQYVGEFVEVCTDYMIITYTSTDGNIVIPSQSHVFGANIVSNEYKDGQGVITFDALLKSIGDDAFRKCSSLASITIPNSVSSIGDYAFWDCSSLTSITIPNSVTSIGKWAFAGCSSLTSITIPNSVTSIRDAVFQSCSSLSSITIPNSVTSIGDQAFYECSSLTSITIPNSVTSIGNRAFSECSSLTSVTIPNSVTSIGKWAFGYCSSLTSMLVEEGNVTYDSRENCNAIIETATNTLVVGCKNTTIPNSVTSIGDYAFYECTSLASITIPNSVTSIGDHAFWYCYPLTSITIPNSVTSIGDGAFSNCSSLTSVTIGNSVTSIGNGAFVGCYSLDTVTCLAMTPPASGENVFYGCDNPTLYVPCEALPDYQAHEEWGQFTTIECIASEEAETEEVVIESGTTTVVIIWPTEEGADTYTIVIKKDGEVVCTLTFNAEGQLINIAFAPGRNGNHPAQYAEAVASGGFRFTVTGLEDGTDYTYDITVKDASNQTIHSHTGAFTTQSTTAVDNITTTTANIQKIMRDGQLIILRDGVEYNAIGMEL